MLILHVITDLTPGGAELMLKRLVGTHVGKSGFEHHVISLHGKGSVGPQLESLGIRVEALGMRGPLSFPAAIWRLTKRIRALKPDVVQTWLYHADLIGGLAARIAGCTALIWNVRATHIPGGMGTSRLTEKVRLACAYLSSRLPWKIVFVANSARAVHEALGYDPRKSLVIPNGYVIPPRMGEDGDRIRLRRELEVPDDAVLIGTAGRFNALKDYPLFIAAAAELASRNPTAYFVMMGRGLSPENRTLAQWIEASGWPNRFRLLGEQHELDRRLRGLDIFTLHSISEGFPNVVAEAMALGIPVVVTDVGDAAYLVGESALVIPPQEPAALAAAIEQMMLEGPEARARRGLEGRERVRDAFSLCNIVSLYENLYAASAEPTAWPTADVERSKANEQAGEPFWKGE